MYIHIIHMCCLENKFHQMVRQQLDDGKDGQTEDGDGDGMDGRMDRARRRRRTDGTDDTSIPMSCSHVPSLICLHVSQHTERLR